MPSIYQLKPLFQQQLRPLVRRLHARGVNANQVTAAALLGSVLVGAALAAAAWGAAPSTLFLLLPLWMFLRMALNAIDGMLAREFAQQSALGACLNEIGDVLSDAALILPFALLPGLGVPEAVLVALVALLAVVSEMAGVLPVMIGASRRYDGPMGKSDRAFLFGVLALLYALGWWQPLWQTAAMAIIALLLAWTSLNRIRAGLREAAQLSHAKGMGAGVER